MVQHPGSRLEHADSTFGYRPARPPARPPRLISGLLRLLWGRWLPELHEAVQLVDERKQISISIHSHQVEGIWFDSKDEVLILLFYIGVRTLLSTKILLIGEKE